jgi:hypothetical protein
VAEEQKPEEKRRWWRIPLGWFADETFYRDITKSAISTAVVALCAYLYAIGAGYVRSPTGWQTIVGVINVVLPPVFGVLVLWAWFYSPEKHRHRPRWVQRALYIFVLLCGIFTALVLCDSMARPLPFWPFTTKPFTLHFKDGTTF